MHRIRSMTLAAALVSGCVVQSPAEEGPTDPREAEQASRRGAPSPNRCVSDSDCTAAKYSDPAAAGGCCPAIAGPSCVPPVVTAVEAARRQSLWEQSCSSVRCPPSASCAVGTWTPEPRCHDGACVDAAAPGRAPAPPQESVAVGEDPEDTETGVPIETAGGPVRCTNNHGFDLVCSGDRIYGIRVSPARDGTFHRVAWRQHVGSLKRWRETALYDSGLVHFIIDPGAGNAKRWWTLSRWIFPRTQRITVARYPGTLRFEITDSTGTVWVLAGTKLSDTRTSFVIESIGEEKQSPRKLAKSDAGIVGVDLAGSVPFLLQQRVASYSPYADRRAAAFLNKKSRFRDGKGKTCAVANRHLFGDKGDGKRRNSDFLFQTDAELVEFLSSRCPRLDLELLRNATPPPPVPRRRFTK